MQVANLMAIKKEEKTSFFIQENSLGLHYYK